MDLIERQREYLEGKVAQYVERQPSGCWLWRGSRGHNAGQLTLGPARGGPKNLLAHRLVYELDRGPIPAGKNLRRQCPQGMCCNPDHHVLVTRAEERALAAALRAAVRAAGASTSEVRLWAARRRLLRGYRGPLPESVLTAFLVDRGQPVPALAKAS